jgi:hypothetical protein
MYSLGDIGDGGLPSGALRDAHDYDAAVLIPDGDAYVEVGLAPMILCGGGLLGNIRGSSSLDIEGRVRTLGNRLFQVLSLLLKVRMVEALHTVDVDVPWVGRASRGLSRNASTR